jgi:predicted amidohydrolase YtcJ
MKPALFKSIILLFLVLLPCFACQPERPKADLIITNANIWTGNEQQPRAQSMAIIDDTISAIGSDLEMTHFKGAETKLIDMHGAFITPGFIDTHVHLMMGGNSLLSVALRDADTPEEFTRRIAAFTTRIEPGSWILEGNWDHTLWGGELPHKEWIDDVTNENPVALYRLDGHMLLANSLALQISGIDKDFPDIEGGEIVRDAEGNPTGILKDNAMNVLLEKIPPMTSEAKEKALKAAMSYLLSNGVTSVHDVDSLGTYAIAEKLKEAGDLSIRIYAMSPLNHWDKSKTRATIDDKWLKTGGLKGFVDGSLGSHTAAFNEPYLDKVKDKGFFINNPENLYQWISSADKAHHQVMVHAIGDSAIHRLLDIYKQVIKENGPSDRRFRVEHAQHLAPEDIVRFSELGVIASMQPYHAIDDGRWAEALIGPVRIKTTYAFKSLLDANATLVFGSDWPVAPATPLEGIYAAVTRRTLDGKNPQGWVPEQKITVEQALKAYTKDAAYASFDENRKGSLAPGKLADFVVISEDLTQGDPVRIKALKIVQTFMGGKKVFELMPQQKVPN